MVRVDFYYIDKKKWLSALEHSRFTHHFLKRAVAEMFFQHCNFADYQPVLGNISVNYTPRYELKLESWQEDARCGVHIYLTDCKSQKTLHLRSMVVRDGRIKKRKKWYAVQLDRTDDWGTGSYSFLEAYEMLKEQGSGLIAVIDEETSCCLCEISYNEVIE